jgi:NitT/TauT family transport system ATP-binding protein
MTKIIEVKGLCKAFKKADKQELMVLKDINLTLHEKEIVCLLGKSGSGKSTLLRIIAGLIPPSEGEVRYRDKRIQGPAAGIAMVFQNFALLPWLTVLQNVELGLEALGIPREERQHRAVEAIDIIGLDGFESAYPRELSGGMRQRVGFARALVVNPDVLLMDEPFSALDVLTAENLKHDLLDLWQAEKTSMSSIIMVTHSIEEAAMLADRILIFGNDPGYIRTEVKVDLSKPRNDQDPAYRNLVDKIYTLLTTDPKEQHRRAIHIRQIDIGYRLPEVDLSELSGLIDTLRSAEFPDRVDLPELADYLSLDINDLFPLTETLEILGFAEVSAGDIELSDTGKAFADADLQERKKIFAKKLLSRVPLASQIRQVLDSRSGNKITQDYFITTLETYLSEKEAERVLRTVIDWARYAELFAYDVNTGTLSLENPG